MKIYEEIIIDMNPESSSYEEIIYEDSYEHDGEMIMQMKTTTGRARLGMHLGQVAADIYKKTKKEIEDEEKFMKNIGTIMNIASVASLFVDPTGTTAKVTQTATQGAQQVAKETILQGLKRKLLGTGAMGGLGKYAQSLGLKAGAFQTLRKGLEYGGRKLGYGGDPSKIESESAAFGKPLAKKLEKKLEGITKIKPFQGGWQSIGTAFALQGGLDAFNDARKLGWDPGVVEGGTYSGSGQVTEQLEENLQKEVSGTKYKPAEMKPVRGQTEGTKPWDKGSATERARQATDPTETYERTTTDTGTEEYSGSSQDVRGREATEIDTTKPQKVKETKVYEGDVPEGVAADGSISQRLIQSVKNNPYAYIGAGGAIGLLALMSLQRKKGA